MLHVFFKNRVKFTEKNENNLGQTSETDRRCCVQGHSLIPAASQSQSHGMGSVTILNLSVHRASGHGSWWVFTDETRSHGVGPPVVEHGPPDLDLWHVYTGCNKTMFMLS